ncbi:cysteine methyltransferase [Endozoicomonas sp. OPT23]|uniref:methylated-DNA--[protein]-cysteine S-methyltransferase n=1 Tax=Endozoicomonas sp. OPT23 TaxID=2072845 RepID=UPI00129A473E|nr:methylated-DNA--[protein]-cysteine S-methyltransferase [Endozoicomonas sp. OPT23]MRI34029.1 cysteine methyltransferase [Endozoicomonas sp. OPT23]
MNTIEIQYHKTTHTKFILGSYEGELCLLDFRYRKMRETVDSRLRRGVSATFIEQDNELLQETRKQLDEYLGGGRKEFDLPLKLIGSDFQQSVWNALLEIPYGETSSYLELARTINNEKAVRAVANANGANAIGIIIPCHRIIGSNGELVGYGGGLPLKKKLLDLEKSKHANLAFDF